MKQKVQSFLNRKGIQPLLSLICGGCFSFAFAPYYQWILVPLCLSFLFGQINRPIPRKKVFYRAFLFGFGLGAVSTGWLANAILLDEGLVWAVPLAWIGMGIFFGLFFWVPGLLSTFFTVGVRRLWAWAALITLFEWIRSWFLTGFPWNLIGSVWEDTLPVLQSASVWGVYGLSFLTIVTCSTLAFWPRKRPVICAILALIVIYGMGSLRLYTSSETEVWGVSLRVVQPNIPQTLKWDPAEAEKSFLKIMRLSRQDNKNVTHVIWPESAVTFLVNRDNPERLRLMQAVPQGGTLILGGLRAVGGRDVANSLFILDDLANIQGYYDKSHLVPFGEYVPLRGILPIDKLVPIAFDLISGKGVQTIRTGKTPPVGPLVCYEVIFSGRVADKKNRPAWLVNVTNDGWYGISAGPYQHLGMAKMRAVEEGLPLVRAANTGVSAVFDGYGRTLGEIALGTEGVLDTRLPVALSAPPYARFGVGIPILFSILVLLFLGLKRK